MRTSERRQLKQDRFAETTKETISWAVEHRAVLVTSLIAAAVVVAIGLGSWWYWNTRNQQANMALGKAMETYNAPLRPASTPAPSEMVTFTSAQERARVAHNEFQKVADQYGHTSSGKIARYMAGITAIDAGDTKGGEQELKEVADTGNNDISALAKLALAGVYRNTGRDKDAVELYKSLMAKPAPSVSKATAQLALASLYEATNQGTEANKLYAEILKQEPRSAAAGIANEKMQAAK